MKIIKLTDGLNPCCSGYYALRSANLMSFTPVGLGLNPCCSGYYALSQSV